jgi:hypothetical protein
MTTNIFPVELFTAIDDEEVFIVIPEKAGINRGIRWDHLMEHVAEELLDSDPTFLGKESSFNEILLESGDHVTLEITGILGLEDGTDLRLSGNPVASHKLWLH